MYKRYFTLRDGIFGTTPTPYAWTTIGVTLALGCARALGSQPLAGLHRRRRRAAPRAETPLPFRRPSVLICVGIFRSTWKKEGLGFMNSVGALLRCA